MAIRTITELKKWFRKGLYPTESQFGDLIDSFRHRSEKIGVGDVEGLSGCLNDAYGRKEGEALERALRGACERVEELQNDYSDIWRAKGEAGGFAPLDEVGKISEEYLPSGSRGACWLRGVVGSAEFEAMEPEARRGLWYVSDRGMVVGAEDDGTISERVPEVGVIYVDESHRELLVWTGTEMASLGGGLLRMVEQSESAVTIEPGVLNRWGEMAVLAVDFAPKREGYASEYCMEFVSGEVPTNLSLPAGVKFPDEPTIEANMRYQISVVNGIGLIAGVGYEYGDAELESDAEPIGIGLLLKNGRKIDYAKMNGRSHFPKEVVDGIVFEKEGLSVVMALEPTQCYFCGGNSVCADVEVCISTAVGSGRVNGREQTTNLRGTLTEGGWAVNVAYAKTFTYKGQHGYLPAAGEMWRVLKYKGIIDALLGLCGVEGMTKPNYWTSTLGGRVDEEGAASSSVTDRIHVVFGAYPTGALDGFNCQGYYWALPFTEYSGEESV